jgi:hypothetical protein
MYRTVGSGVVRIETTACGGGSVGTGFLVAPDLVATVAHVLSGARGVVLRTDSGDTVGDVIGLDAGRDLALVRAGRPLSGHVFTLADADPAVGATVAAIGYPLAGPRSLTRGAVSALLPGFIQTDAAVNPGNSGGPLLTADGTVVGIVDAKRRDGEGIGYALPATAAAPLLHAWQAVPASLRLGGSCSDASGSSQIEADVTVGTSHPDAGGIASTLRTYATGINTGDYAAAYDRLGPNELEQNTPRGFAAGHASSYLVDVHLERVWQVRPLVDRAVVSFTSFQDPAYGQQGETCTRWRITYTMNAEDGDGWLIDDALAARGYPRPCEG